MAKTFEQRLQDFGREMTGIFDSAVSTLVTKRRTYGEGNLTRFGRYGILVRSSDKIERLVKMYENGTLSAADGESERDAWSDLMCYAALAIREIELEEAAKPVNIARAVGESIGPGIARGLRETQVIMDDWPPFENNKEVSATFTLDTKFDAMRHLFGTPAGEMRGTIHFDATAAADTMDRLREELHPEYGDFEEEFTSEFTEEVEFDGEFGDILSATARTLPPINLFDWPAGVEVFLTPNWPFPPGLYNAATGELYFSGEEEAS